jgi:tetratricopeptide (TPR) repeat protein
MQTKLSRICSAIIEAGWLAALIVIPLFFNTFSNRVFEPDKLHILRSIALLMAVVWVVEFLDGGWRSLQRGQGLGQLIRKTPLVLPTLILVGCYILSTALSVVPRISLLGSYVRLQGTFTYVSYVVMFFVTLTHLRTRAQVNRIFHAVILTSLPIGIYALIQHLGIDPLPWGGDTKERVAANMGNAIFVAAYLIMAVFLTLERLVNSVVAVLSTEDGSTADALRAAGYLFILAVQFVAIVFTQSRGPWLGLATGLYVFGMLGILLLARWSAGRARLGNWLAQAVRPIWAALIALSVAGIAFLVVFNLPNTPLSSLRHVRYVGRLSTLFSTTEGTNAVRVLIWEGVVNMMLEPHPPITAPDGTPDKLNAIRPLVGYGPESMWVAYNPFYPPDLAHYEARNASPDRSHNETFDTLVRTGALGFAAQLFLYISIFFYSLRWLGLIQSRARRNLFIASLLVGGALGVVVLTLADHSLRLAGIGLPAGIIAGLIVYVTLDLLLAPSRSKPTSAADPVKAQPISASGIGRESDGHGVATENGNGVVPADAQPSVAHSAEDQLLILALFATIVAHFAEIHFGIAIASTLTYFWILSAVLVVVGMGWLDRVDETATIPAAVRDEGYVASKATPTPAIAAASAKGSRSASVSKAGAVQPRRATTSPRSQTVTRASRHVAPAVTPRSAVYSFLPYAGIIMLITLVIVWDFLVTQTGATNPLTILWDAFTKRTDRTAGIVTSPMLLILMLFTWLVGGMIALAENYRLQPVSRRYPWGANAAIYATAAIGTWLVYGLIQAGRSTYGGLQGLAIFQKIADHIVVFDVILLLAMLLLALAAWLSDLRPRPIRWFNYSAALPVIATLVLTPLALAGIYNLNIQIVRADTYYKQGLAYDGQGQAESAIVLYNEAAKIEPTEDYYYLFLGRGLLEFASAAQPATATLPSDLSAIATRDLLPLVQAGLEARGREDVMRGTYAALTAAQRLNPLNTDHTANLARLFRAWAFSNIQNPNEAPSNQALRQLVVTRPKDVDMAKLNQSLQYYREATSLSPQNAQLWNEMSSVQYILGDTQGAKASLDRSLALDQEFPQTYLLMGDLLAETGDKKGALDAYQHVSALQPGNLQVLGIIGVYAAQAGDLPTAMAAFSKVITSETGTMNAAQAQLAALDAQASKLGGYDNLGANAKARQQALQTDIANYGAQLHQTYRNEALVLRDAGRVDEALTAAQKALALANDQQKADIQQLIAELQQKKTSK